MVIDLEQFIMFMAQLFTVSVGVGIVLDLTLYAVYKAFSLLHIK